MFSSTKKGFCFVVLVAVLFVMAACIGVSAESNVSTGLYPDDVTWIHEIEALSVAYLSDDAQDPNEAPEPLPDAVVWKYVYEALNNVYRSSGIPHRYVYIPEDNNMRFIDYDGIVSLFTDGTGVFMFGRYACSWCRIAAPVWVDFARDKNIYIYYFNPTYDRENDTAVHQSLLALLHNYLPVNDRDQDITGDDFDPEWKRITVPHFFFVYEGEVKAHWMANAHELLRGDYDLEAVREKFDYMYSTWRGLPPTFQIFSYMEYIDDCYC